MSPDIPFHHLQRRLLCMLACFGMLGSVIGSALGQTQPTDTSPTDAKSLSQKTEYLRVTVDEAGKPLALETALTRFRTSQDEDLIVDLIGAVHIGEGDYYERLNQQFELYDVVLYELVAPQGTRIPRGSQKSTNNPISFLQSSAQKMLGLESQLQLIDYQKENLVHADMSPGQISKKMEERGQTTLSLGITAFSEMMKAQNKLAREMKNSQSTPGPENLFALMSNPLKLKQVMANQFTRDGALENGLGKTLNRMLIDDRNQAAMKVLEKEIAKGHKRIGIFYGAAHMSDFEKRLNRNLGMKRTKQAWLEAWDLTTAPQSKSNSPAQMLFQLMKQLDN